MWPKFKHAAFWSSKYQRHPIINILPITRSHSNDKQLYSQMPITPPYANVDSSPVWELRATAVDSYETQQPHTSIVYNRVH